jgi:hypothetical protein
MKEFEIDEIDKKINDFNINSVIEQHRSFLVSNTPLKNSNDEGLIANGWVLGPFDEQETFIDSDFSLLENFILKIGLKQIQGIIAKWENKIGNKK